jgi:hypothetical protein
MGEDKPSLISPDLPAVKPEIGIDNHIGEWQVCISFGKSSSPNFEKALFVAQSAPHYIETKNEKGQPIYQSFWGRDQFLRFVALYEAVNNWKSCFVFINNELVDRKIVGGINYCCGDKIRSGDPRFCFGASSWTENPFGCHRAQMHTGRDAWYTFGVMDKHGIFHVDIDRIVEELRSRLKLYVYCPELNMDEIIAAARRLPKKINPRKESQWEYITYHLPDETPVYGVAPQNRFKSMIEVKISLDDIIEKKKLSVAKASGCLLPLISSIALLLMIILMIVAF